MFEDVKNGLNLPTLCLSAILENSSFFIITDDVLLFVHICLTTFSKKFIELFFFRLFLSIDRNAQHVEWIVWRKKSISCSMSLVGKLALPIKCCLFCRIDISIQIITFHLPFTVYLERIFVTSSFSFPFLYRPKKALKKANFVHFPIFNIVCWKSSFLWLPIQFDGIEFFFVVEKIIKRHVITFLYMAKKCLSQWGAHKKVLHSSCVQYFDVYEGVNVVNQLSLSFVRFITGCSSLPIRFLTIFGVCAGFFMFIHLLRTLEHF